MSSSKKSMKKYNTIIYELCNKYDKELTQTFLLQKFGMQIEPVSKKEIPPKLHHLSDEQRIEFATWLEQEGYLSHFHNLKARQELKEKEILKEAARLRLIAQKEKELQDELDETKRFFKDLKDQIDGIDPNISSYTSGKIYLIVHHDGAYEDYVMEICEAFFFKKKCYERYYTILEAMDGPKAFDSYEIQEISLMDHSSLEIFVDLFEKRKQDAIDEDEY